MESANLIGFNGALLVIFIYILYRCFSQTFLTEFKRNPALFQRTLAAIVLMASLWSLQASLQPGLHIHFLGTTALVLMFRWRKAVWICAFSSLICLAAGTVPPPYLGLFLTGSVLIPLTFSYLVSYAVHQKLPHHLFIYLFIGTFLNAALTMMVKQGAMAGLLWWDGSYSWQVLIENYLILTPLLLFPEALLNGMAITLMAVYRPEWLSTFNQSDYLSG